MAKTIDGKFIFTHKGEDYVPLEDYVKLLNVIEEVREYIKNKGSCVDSYDGQTIFHLGEENQIELLQILDKATEKENESR